MTDAATSLPSLRHGHYLGPTPRMQTIQTVTHEKNKQVRQTGPIKRGYEGFLSLEMFSEAVRTVTSLAAVRH